MLLEVLLCCAPNVVVVSDTRQKVRHVTEIACEHQRWVEAKQDKVDEIAAEYAYWQQQRAQED